MKVEWRLFPVIKEMGDTERLCAQEPHKALLGISLKINFLTEVMARVLLLVCANQVFYKQCFLVNGINYRVFRLSPLVSRASAVLIFAKNSLNLSKMKTHFPLSLRRWLKKILTQELHCPPYYQILISHGQRCTSQIPNQGRTWWPSFWERCNPLSCRLLKEHQLQRAALLSLWGDSSQDRWVWECKDKMVFVYYYYYCLNFLFWIEV